MSIFDTFSDVPHQIRNEGQEITIKFERVGENAGRISWNIPPPARGCSADNRAYDGIVITLSNVPANYVGTSPKNGVYYDGDPTADVDTNLGSVLDTARVVAALYHDTTTVSIDITDIKPRTPYYISGYAVDAVGRYHTEGVHAYSLPTGAQSYVATEYPAHHEIQIYSLNPLSGRSPTGLLASQSYVLPVKMECKRYDITVAGADSLTYKDLVAALNVQFSLMVAPYTSPTPPSTGSYYFDVATQLLYIWDGYRLVLTPVLISQNDPAVNPPADSYWFNTTNNTLYKWGEGWGAVTGIITSTEAPTELACSDVWYDGTTVRKFESNHWCDYTTIIASRNPQFAPLFSCNDFWYKPTDKEIFKWNTVIGGWEDALVIYSDFDPNTAPNTNSYWYDETLSKMKKFDGVAWEVITNIDYADSDADGNPPSTMITNGDRYWFDTRLLELNKRDANNTIWLLTAIPYLSYPTNPYVRKSCDLWWNSSPSVDDLFVWETLTSSWVTADNFYRQDADPNTPPLLDEHTAWVADDGTIYLIETTSCEAVNYINSTIDPRTIVDGAVWLDPAGNYYELFSGEWTLLPVTYYPTDPNTAVANMLWYNPILEELKKYVSSAWVDQCLFLDKSFMPAKYAQWFNSVEDLLMEWDGLLWLPTSSYIRAEFALRKCLTDYDALVFYTRKTGCHESFSIMSDGNTLFAGLSNSVMYMDPVDGSNDVDAGAMYLQLGVGSDGSPDERRMLHETIRISLGHPAIRVELTKPQLDRCIDNALLMLRKNSSYAYKNGMFFLDLIPNQQVYRLSNRCVGFNKIVTVTGLHRPKAGAFKMAYSQNDNFAFAALQQMYTLGTFDILTYHLTASYIEELDTLFASRIMFQWLERPRELKLYQVPHGRERVIVEAMIERTEQELLSDRETAHWLQRWAIADAKSILAQTRGKFVTLPGPNGNTQLNQNDLMSQVTEEKTQLIEEVESMGMQDLVDCGMRAHFIIG